jgi:hypothetical protein
VNEHDGQNVSIETLCLSAEQKRRKSTFSEDKAGASLGGWQYLIQEVYEESLVILRTALQAEAVTLGCMESVTAHKVSAWGIRLTSSSHS